MCNIGIGTTVPQYFIHLYANHRSIAKVNHAGDIEFEDELTKDDLREAIKVLLQDIYRSAKDTDLILHTNGNVGISSPSKNLEMRNI